MRLTFVGAAQEVTGSCFLVETDGVRFLVDRGMFQKHHLRYHLCRPECAIVIIGFQAEGTLGR